MTMQQLHEYRKKVPGTCVICKTAFPPSYTNRRYCGPTCRKRNQRERDKTNPRRPVRLIGGGFSGFLGQLIRTEVDIAPAVRLMRKEMGVSRHVFGVATGVTSNTVRMWELGRMIPGDRSRENLAMVYARFTRDIYYGETNGPGTDEE